MPPNVPTAPTPYDGTRPLIGQDQPGPDSPPQPAALPAMQTNPPQMIEGATLQPQPAQPAVPPQPLVMNPATQPQIAPQLNDDQRVQTFKANLMQLDYECQQLFYLPLDVFMTMVHRNATNEEMAGNGRMRIFAGMSQFVPDYPTLGIWIDAYMNEVRRQKAIVDARQAGGPEMV